MRQPARVAIGGSGLEISLTETGRTFRWPLAGVRQTQGFYEGEQVRLEHGGKISDALLIADVAFLTALRAAAPDVAPAFHDPRRRRFFAAAGVLAAIATLAGTSSDALIRLWILRATMRELAAEGSAA